MGKICNEDNLQNLDYEKKLKVLLANRIALLDVIQTCNIAVSLDSNIQNEKPNKIVQLLKEFPNIYTICLNGNKSYTAFKKHFPELLKQYQCFKLPSTSPVNARYSLEKLYEEWKDIFEN